MDGTITSTIVERFVITRDRTHHTATANRVSRRAKNAGISPRIVLIGSVLNALLLIAMRGQWLFSTSMLNPDEAELLAAGKRAAMDILPYKTYTTDTYLMVWPTFLGILDRLGIPLSFRTAHVLSGLFYLFLTTSGWYLIARRVGWKCASAIVIPAAAFIYAEGASSLNSAYNFYALSTELLPIAFIVGASIILFAGHAITQRRLMVAAVLGGISVLAKPQVGLLAVSLLVSAVIIAEIETTSATMRSRVARIGILSSKVAAAFVLPIVLAIAFMFVSGTFPAFTHEALGTVLGYIDAGNATSETLGQRISTMASFLSTYPFAFCWAVGGLLLVVLGNRHGSIRGFALRLLAWVLPLLASVITLLVLSGIFPHYANIVYGGSMMSAVVGARLFSSVEHSRAMAFRFSLGILSLGSLALVLVSVTALVGTDFSPVADYMGDLVTGHRPTAIDPYNLANSTLPTLCPADSSVLVWGWAAELYSYFNWQPASRYVISTWQLDDSAQQRYYKRTLLNELDSNPPRCIVEALGNFFFGQYGPASDLDVVVPGTKSLLSYCYVTKTSNVGFTSSAPLGEIGQPVTVYVRTAACRVRRDHGSS